MKSCVMMAAQGDPVVHVQAKLGKKNDGQDVMGVQMIPPTATPARTVAGPHGSRPFLARPTVPERLLDAPVRVVGIVLASVQPRQESGLSFAPFARLRTVGTVPVSILAGFVDAAAHFAREPVGSRIGQRSIDDVQDALVPTDGPDVPAEVLAGLQVGTESAAGPGHHLSERRLARPAAEPALKGVPATPGAVLPDHMTMFRHNGDLSL